MSMKLKSQLIIYLKISFLFSEATVWGKKYALLMNENIRLLNIDFTLI